MTSQEKFEKWYVENSFDLITNPLGSRECSLQRKSWQACEADQADTIAQLQADNAKLRELLKKND